MQSCQSAAYASANRRLAIALRKALALLPPDRQAKLNAAQRLWTAFRSSDCGVFAGSQTGTIATIEGASCLIERTTTRIAELAAFSVR